MAIIMIDHAMFKEMPGIYEHLRRKVGYYILRNSLVPGVTEVVYESKKFATNEVVVLRFYNNPQKTLTRCISEYISRSDKPFFHGPKVLEGKR
jgi:hypothetical protein